MRIVLHVDIISNPCSHWNSATIVLNHAPGSLHLKFSIQTWKISLINAQHRGGFVPCKPVCYVSQCLVCSSSWWRMQSCWFPASKQGAAGGKVATASTGIVIGVVIAIFILLLVVVDISCFFVNGCGVTARLCGKEKIKKKSVEEGEKYAPMIASNFLFCYIININHLVNYNTLLRLSLNFLRNCCRVWKINIFWF